MRAVVHQAVRDVRTAPTSQPDDPPADPALTALRRVVDELAASTYRLGELVLEAAPAYLSDTEAPTSWRRCATRSAVRFVEPLTTGVAAPAHPNATGHFIKALSVIEPFIN